MKPGANRSDQHEIFVLMNQGHTAAQISRIIGVYPETVKNFMAAYKKKGFKPVSSAMLQAKRGMPKHPGQANALLEQELLPRDAEISDLKSRIAELEKLTQTEAPAATTPTKAATAKATK